MNTPTTNWKRWTTVAILFLLINALMLGAFLFPGEIGNIFADGSVQTLSPAEQSTLPQEKTIEEERAEMLRNHRPVVVQFVDATPDSMGRAGGANTPREYYLTVSYVTEEEASPADNVKRITVAASLGNLTGPAITVAQDALVLVDPAQVRYTPVADEGTDASDLVGATLNPDESVYGFISFEVPAEFTEGTLEFCIDGAASCQQVISAPLP